MTEDPSIAELHGLDQHDPWSTVTEAQRKIADQQQQLWDSIQQKIGPETSFADPPDDESLVISQRPQRFWRITVENQRLKDVVAIAPQTPKQAITMRNNHAGCWIALTSVKVARHLVQHFRENTMTATLIACTELGTPVNCGIVQKPSTERILYGLIQEQTGARAFFVSEAFWNEHHHLSGAAVSKVPPMFRPTERADCFHTSADLLLAKAALDEAGYVEHLLVAALVNETMP